MKGVPAGLPSLKKTRALDAGRGLWLVVADAPLSEYGQEGVERTFRDVASVSRAAVAHERVIEHFGLAPAVLPSKLFTLFASDARALAFVEERRRQLDRLLERVEGRREWSVRISVDAAKSSSAIERKAGPAPRSGTDFLARKQRLRTERDTLVDRGRTRADALFESFGRLAAERKRRSENEAEPGSKLLLDAVYLVPTARRTRFVALARKAAQELSRGGMRLDVSGPWPPYHFAA